MNAAVRQSGTATRGRILCVDDERQVLEGLSSYLRIYHEVETATNAADAIAYLEEKPALDVIISDMRMPNIDGAQFLVRAQELAPHVSRILLTGYSDLNSVAAAVNDAKIFRLLTKPCPPQVMLAAVEAAIRQSRAAGSERERQESILRGCVEALAEILALRFPRVFARARQLQLLVTQMAQELRWEDQWQFAMAAVVSQLALAVGGGESGRRREDAEGSTKEPVVLEQLPQFNDRVLARVPNMDGVRAMIVNSVQRYEALEQQRNAGMARAVVRGAQLLRVAGDYMLLVERGQSAADTLAMLKAATEVYDPTVLAALAKVIADRQNLRKVSKLAVSGLAPGMKLAEDLTTTDGVLIMQSGGEVTAALIDKLRSFRQGSIHEPIQVFASEEEALAS